jgi:hypothetical protein
MTASTANFGYTYPTLVDVLKRLDPNGSIASIGEVLTKKNPLLQDMAFKEGNLPTGHQFTSRAALPALTWRRFNQGVDATKSTTDQHIETCGMLTGFSKVDVDLAELNGNAAAYRASEDISFVESFNNMLNASMFYSSVVANPEQIHGLSPRLSCTTANPAAVSGTGPTGTGQIIKADDTASGSTQTSIWCIGWSDDTVFGIFPKGSVGGLQHHDMGEQLVPDAQTKYFRALVSEWKWKIGLCVKDYRFVSRVCNIDVDNWTNDLSAGADLAMRMMDASSAIYDVEACRPVYYMSRQTYNMLTQQMVARQANWLAYVDEGGSKCPHLYGIPIKFCDCLTATEAVVS